MAEPTNRSEREGAGRTRRADAESRVRPTPPPRPAQARRASAPRGQSGHRLQIIFAIVALVIVITLVLGSLLTVLPFGLGSTATPTPFGGAPASSNIVPTYEARVRANPQDADAMLVLANTLQNQGDYPGAIGWYERAVALQPDRVDWRLAFGQALYSYGQLFDAEVQYQRAIALDPQNADAEYALGNLYVRWNPPRLEEARIHLMRASELQPEGSTGRAARAALDRLNATPTAATPTP
jgi:cytochrome c-type biogenesis protein CcmH/NrfG